MNEWMNVYVYIRWLVYFYWSRLKAKKISKLFVPLYNARTSWQNLHSAEVIVVGRRDQRIAYPHVCTYMFAVFWIWEQIYIMIVSHTAKMEFQRNESRKLYISETNRRKRMPANRNESINVRIIIIIKLLGKCKNDKYLINIVV